MPNHVHAVVRPFAPHPLPEILKTWKGFSARQANRVLSHQGEFWQPESYDHLIRDDVDLVNAIRYVRDNPLKAGLVDWAWVWQKPNGLQVS